MLRSDGDEPVTLEDVAATARRVADAIGADAEAHADRAAMAAALVEAADSVDRLAPHEALLDLRSALVRSRTAWDRMDPGLAAEARRVLAGAKRLAMRL